MEKREAQKELVKEWYRALEAGDADAMLAVQRDDVIYNVHGTTPVSGRFQGKDTLVNDIFPKVMGMLQMDTFKFCTKHTLRTVPTGRHRSRRTRLDKNGWCLPWIVLVLRSVGLEPEGACSLCK